MTHEQKPGSAAFRTREAQIETMTVHYMEAGFPINAARRLARDGVAEAEARGAAEQRRKDVEGAVAWVDPTFLPSSDYPWTDARLLLEDGTKGTIPLYTRPANVAAHEARVKELEGALRNVRAAIEQADPKVLVCTLWMPGPPETVADYISAAVREGGEHG